MSTTAPPPTEERKHVVPLGGSLFRSEVLQERQSQWLGTVLLVPRTSQIGMSVFAVLVAAGILAIVFVAHYTRAARVNGWLMPEEGIIQIFAPQPGVLSQVNVQEGAEVRKGTPLLRLSTELQSEALGETRKAVVHQLHARRESLVAQKQRQQEIQAQQADELTARLATKRAQLSDLERDFQLQRARMNLATQTVEMQSELYSKHLAAVMVLRQAQENVLQQALTMQTLERDRTALKLEVLGLRSQLSELPLKNQQELAETDRNIAALDQEIAEAEARREIVITAPEDGTVTAIQAEPGGGVNTNVPLLSIIPEGSKLRAQLFAPSRVVGFVRPGQRVLLRYEAFPYQKFGHYEGTVTSISRSAISPSLLSQQLTGLSSLYGMNVPVYQINVALGRQTVTVYGRSVPLQSGMQLQADVLIDKRRLFEWVLDPIFTLTGKWHG